MKKYLKNFIIILLLGTYIYLYVFYILDKFLKYSESITACFFIVITFVAYLFYGFAKDKKTYARKSILQIIATQIIIYFLVIYGLGLVVGFLSNSYSLKASSIIDNVFAPIAIIVSMELLRYIFIVPNKNQKVSIAFLTIFFVMVEAIMSIKAYPLNEISGLFRFLTLVFIPLTVKHYVLSYLTYYVGYKPSLLYRLVLDCYMFFVPIFPDLGDYLLSMFSIGLPFLVYLYSSRFISDFNDGVQRDFVYTTFKPFDFVVIALFFCLAALISGYFPCFLLGVGSASMEPSIKVGDAVFGVKVKENELKLNDILIFKGEDKIVVHRLVRIEKKNGKYYYHTKGDNNNTEDVLDVTYDSIKGKVVFRIPYIAYPSVYISELLNGGD